MKIPQLISLIFTDFIISIEVISLKFTESSLQLPSFCHCSDHEVVQAGVSLQSDQFDNRKKCTQKIPMCRPYTAYASAARTILECRVQVRHVLNSSLWQLQVQSQLLKHPIFTIFTIFTRNLSHSELSQQAKLAPGNHGFPPQVSGSSDAIASSKGRPVLSSAWVGARRHGQFFLRGAGMIQPLSLTWSIFCFESQNTGDIWRPRRQGRGKEIQSPCCAFSNSSPGEFLLTGACEVTDSWQQSAGCVRYVGNFPAKLMPMPGLAGIDHQ